MNGVIAVGGVSRRRDMDGYRPARGIAAALALAGGRAMVRRRRRV